MMTAVEAAGHPLVAGRFEVIETLGRGGMGVVYRARDRERSLEVALKTLRGVTPESVLRFKTEFRALRDVRHPNLVELGELFENDGTWFFTMELVRGTPLMKWISADPSVHDTISPAATSDRATIADDDATSVETPASVIARNAEARACRVDRLPAPCCDIARLRVALAGLVRGLSALHAAGKVHRDVKPSNILVDDRDRLVLLDFGVVAELGRAQHEKLLFGTIKYMAPEQARGEPVGPHADWYAVGVLVYQAITGQLPFAGVSADELLVLKQHVDPPPPSELVAGVPADLDLLVRSLLDRDPQRRPTETEIFDVLGVDSDDAPALPRAHDIFVGRQRELAALDGALADSRQHAVTVIVEGESGVGKTALVARFAELAQGLDQRLVVLRGRCHERERVPFNALDGVVDDLTRFLLVQREARVARLVPEGVAALLAVFPALRAVHVFGDAAALEHATDVDVRGRAFAALRELLARVCWRRALVIALDDLQWADGDSCALLDELLHGDAPRLCLIATKRPHEGAAIMKRLGSVRRLELGGLDTRDAEELVRMVAHTATGKAAQIAAETRGHPLFVRELALHPASVAVPLEDAIWSRASRLPAGAQRLLAAVAVAGSPISRHVAVAVAELAAADAELAVAALTREHLVRVHGPRPQDAIEPFHDRIREAVYAHQPIERQRELHRALATALEAAGAPAAQLLSRYEAAGDFERAGHYLVAAAEAARSAFAFGRAAELFRRALETDALAADRRVWLLVQLAEALANDGRTAEAAERYLEASMLEPADSERHLDLLRHAAERFLMSGHLDKGLETARGVLERAGMTLPATRMRTVAGIVWNQLRLRGRTLDGRAKHSARCLSADICWSMGAGLGMVDSLLGAYFSGRAARLALARGNALQITRGMAAATIGAALLDRRERAARLIECAERAAEDDGTPLAHWYAALGRTGLSFILDNDWVRAHRDATALENEWYAAGHGPGWETDLAMHFSLAAQQMMGEIRELGRRVAMLVHNAQRNGDLFQEVTLRVRFAVRHLLIGRPDEARDDVREALAAWLPGTDSFGNQRAWALWSRTRIALYTGILDDDLDSEWQRMHRSLVGRVPLMQAEWLHAYGTYLLARAHAAKQAGRASEHASLCRATTRVAGRVARLRFPAAPVSEAILRAGIAWARGGDAVELTRHALDQAIENGLFVYAPFLKRRLGEAIGGDEGATLVSQADAFAVRMGWTDPVRGAELALPTGRFV